MQSLADYDRSATKTDPDRCTIGRISVPIVCANIAIVINVAKVENAITTRHKGHLLARAAGEYIADAAPTSALHVSAYARVTAGTLLAHD